MAGGCVQTVVPEKACNHASAIETVQGPGGLPAACWQLLAAEVIACWQLLAAEVMTGVPRLLAAIAW